MPEKKKVTRVTRTKDAAVTPEPVQGTAEEPEPKPMQQTARKKKPTAAQLRAAKRHRTSHFTG